MEVGPGDCALTFEVAEHVRKSIDLASRVLSLIARRLPGDWHARYGYRPALLETFVEKPRSTTLHRHSAPIKGIWLYLLAGDFRRQLCNG